VKKTVFISPTVGNESLRKRREKYLQKMITNPIILSPNLSPQRSYFQKN